MRRCGICRNIGHNQQTCPSQNKAYSAGNVPATRTASGRRSASCSYCRGYLFKIDRTHTRSSCPERKKAREEWIEENSSWAYKFKQDMIAAGMGIGAIVEYGADKVFVVEQINFDEMSMSSSYAYGGRDLSKEENAYVWYQWIPPPGDAQWGCKVLSPISPQMVASQFPKDWEYGTYGVPRKLENTKRNKTRKRSR